MEAQIDTDSSNMAFGGYSVLHTHTEGWGKMKMEVKKKKGRYRKLSASVSFIWVDILALWTSWL